jgi:type IV fimbrial biogenesis protein FimT
MQRHALHRQTRQRAFTLVELMVVLAVLAVIALVAAPSFNDFILMQRLKSINAQLVTDMQFARSEAAARNLVVRVRFQNDTDRTCYVIFTGPFNSCSCLTAPACPPSSVEVRSVQAPTSLGVGISPPEGQVRSFEIDPSTGAMTSGTDDSGAPLSDPFLIDTRIDTTRNLRTVINRSGRPSVCTPAGSSMGAQACS